MKTVYARWRAKLAVREGMLAFARRQAAYWRKRKAKAKRGTAAYSHAGAMLADREAKVAHRKYQVEYAKRVVARHKPTPLAERAYRVAVGLVGVMEHGGNNMGAAVSKIIRANGGAGPEPWCGDFMAYCYRRAGSNRVTRAWAAVRLLRGLVGIRATSKPRRGDLVRFTFDHVGMFVRDLGDGRIETIEGNTGASGAVSDSATGGDGVYRKVRSKALVRDYLHVSG